MQKGETYNWEPGKKSIVDLNKIRAEIPEDCQGQFPSVKEFVASPDGEQIAASLLKEEEVFGVSVNGEFWEGDFEKAWQLTYSPDGRLAALVRMDDMWTLAVDGAPWENQFDFAWNIKFNRDGSAIGVQVKSDNEYLVAVNGKPWEKGFLSCRDYAISDDGQKSAGLVQVEELPEADIFKFLEGTWSVAVDGVAWEEKFLNVYEPVFSPDGAHVAAEVRLDTYEYSVAQDAIPWDARYQLHLGAGLSQRSQRLLAPGADRRQVDPGRGGQAPGRGQYIQLWRVTSQPGRRPAGRRGGPELRPLDRRGGRQTLGGPRSATWCSRHASPPTAARLAAAVQGPGQLDLAVDGELWSEPSRWSGIRSSARTGEVVAAKVERDGRYGLVINGRVWELNVRRALGSGLQPGRQGLLVRGIEDDSYTRQVVPLAELLQLRRMA